MISKIIHYCWFGGNELPDIAEKCINSWQLFLPDYEIKRWDETNFDVCMIPYTKEAYYNKKYAFVSDYVRFWALYHEGGIYFDIDVEVIRDLSPIIEKGPFLGIEEKDYCNPGLGMAAIKGMSFLKDCLDYYATLSFIRKDGSLNYDTVVFHISNLLKERGLKKIDKIQFIAGFYIYPQKYFCPLNYNSKVLTITDSTYTIHHYNASWINTKQKLYKWLKTKLGEKIASYCSKLYYSIFKK